MNRQFKHIHTFMDRHGKRRTYFRCDGYPTYSLPDDRNSDEFRHAYALALRGRRPKSMVKAPVAEAKPKILSRATPKGSKKQIATALDSASIIAMIASFNGPESVYFLAHAKLVKIGTAISVANRFRALQAASPHVLVLMGYVPGSHSIETAIHRMFKDERHRGEWFKASDRLLNFIEDCLGFVGKLKQTGT